LQSARALRRSISGRRPGVDRPMREGPIRFSDFSLRLQILRAGGFGSVEKQAEELEPDLICGSRAMSFVAKLRIYCRLFGWQGPGLALQTRLLRQPKEVTLRLPRLSHPVHLRLKTTDVPTFRKIFGDLEYDFDLAKAPSV